MSTLSNVDSPNSFVAEDSLAEMSESGFFIPTNTETPRFEFLNDPIHERMKGNPFYGKRIQLRSTYGKTAQPVNLEPTHRKGHDNAWLGIPKLSDKQRELMESHGFALAVPGDTYVKAPDGYDIDCGTEAGLYQWEWMQYAPQIISDTDKYDPKKPHEGADKEFYVIVPADEVEKRAKEFVDRLAAADWLRILSPRKWYDVSRLIGSGMDSAKPIDVFNYLMDVAERTPHRLLDVKKDNQADLKLFIKRLLDRGIIRQEDGAYRYETMLLGTSEQQVLDTISQEKYADITRYMRNKLGVDGGFGSVEVPTSYADYSTPNEQLVKQQASAPSATLGHRVPSAPVVPKQPPVDPNALTNQDLDDDYSEEPNEKKPDVAPADAAAQAAAAAAATAAAAAQTASTTTTPLAPRVPKSPAVKP